MGVGVGLEPFARGVGGGVEPLRGASGGVEPFAQGVAGAARPVVGTADEALWTARQAVETGNGTVRPVVHPVADSSTHLAYGVTGEVRPFADGAVGEAARSRKGRRTGGAVRRGPRGDRGAGERLAGRPRG